LVLAQYD
jgi:hypothetical protein